MKRKWSGLSQSEKAMNRKALRKINALNRQKKAVAQRVAKSVNYIRGLSPLDS